MTQSVTQELLTLDDNRKSLLTELAGVDALSITSNESNEANFVPFGNIQWQFQLLQGITSSLSADSVLQHGSER